MLNGASREQIETLVRQLTGGNATNETIHIFRPFQRLHGKYENKKQRKAARLKGL